jgi:hypothetical protein
MERYEKYMEVRWYLWVNRIGGEEVTWFSTLALVSSPEYPYLEVSRAVALTRWFYLCEDAICNK